LLPKIISIDIIFCGLQKTIYHKSHKRYTKAENDNFELYIVCIFKETKAKFLFYKNFCVTFVTFVPFVVLFFLLKKTQIQPQKKL